MAMASVGLVAPFASVDMVSFVVPLVPSIDDSLLLVSSGYDSTGVAVRFVGRLVGGKSRIPVGLSGLQLANPLVVGQSSMGCDWLLSELYSHVDRVCVPYPDKLPPYSSHILAFADMLTFWVAPVPFLVESSLGPDTPVHNVPFFHI